MNAMLVYSLARRLTGTSTTVNGAHPGIIAGTGLGEEIPGLHEAVAARLGELDTTQLPGPDTGADTPAWLATAPELATITGRFYVDRLPVDTADHTTDTDRCDRLWQRSAQLAGMPAETM